MSQSSSFQYFCCFGSIVILVVFASNLVPLHETYWLVFLSVLMPFLDWSYCEHFLRSSMTRITVVRKSKTSFSCGPGLPLPLMLMSAVLPGGLWDCGVTEVCEGDWLVSYIPPRNFSPPKTLEHFFNSSSIFVKLPILKNLHCWSLASEMVRSECSDEIS